MDVSIIIVNYNTLWTTCECVDSVLKYTKGVDFEIILVDNASTDGSREAFESRSDLKYIYLDSNLGFGKANNKGLESACGRNILFLNSDTLLSDDAVSTLVRFLDDNPSAGACGGNLLTTDGRPGQSFERVLPSVWCEFDAFWDYLPSRIRFGRNRCWNYSGRPLRVAMVSGADLMVRKSVLDECGGAFDPSFFMYYEDTELCRRIALHGYSIWSVPEAEIVHLGGGSMESAGTEDRSAPVLKARSRKLASLKIYCDIIGEPKLYEHCLAWRRAQCRMRMAIHLFKPEARRKWRSYSNLYH